MNRILSSLVILFVFLNAISAQNNKKSIYEAKIGSFSGNIEITFRSGGIIEYSLFVNNESGSSVFHQKGFAINPNYDELKAHGMEFGERIGPGKSLGIPACPFIVICNCDKWLDIKIAKDLSLIQIDCGQDLLNQIFGNKSDQNPYTQILGIFYLKSSNK